MATAIPLTIKFKSATIEEFIERYAKNISRGGMFIRTKQLVERGKLLKFEFQLQDGAPLLAGDATVEWTRESDPARPTAPPGMGLRFDRLDEASTQVIDRVLGHKEIAGEAGIPSLYDEGIAEPPQAGGTAAAVLPAAETPEEKPAPAQAEAAPPIAVEPAASHAAQVSDQPAFAASVEKPLEALAAGSEIPPEATAGDAGMTVSKRVAPESESPTAAAQEGALAEGAVSPAAAAPEAPPAAMGENFTDDKPSDERAVARAAETEEPRAAVEPPAAPTTAAPPPPRARPFPLLWTLAGTAVLAAGAYLLYPMFLSGPPATEAAPSAPPLVARPAPPLPPSAPRATEAMARPPSTTAPAPGAVTPTGVPSAPAPAVAPAAAENPTAPTGARPTAAAAVPPTTTTTTPAAAAADAAAADDAKHGKHKHHRHK